MVRCDCTCRLAGLRAHTLTGARPCRAVLSRTAKAINLTSTLSPNQRFVASVNYGQPRASVHSLEISKLTEAQALAARSPPRHISIAFPYDLAPQWRPDGGAIAMAYLGQCDGTGGQPVA